MSHVTYHISNAPVFYLPEASGDINAGRKSLMRPSNDFTGGLRRYKQEPLTTVKRLRWRPLADLKTTSSEASGDRQMTSPEKLSLTFKDSGVDSSPVPVTRPSGSHWVGYQLEIGSSQENCLPLEVCWKSLLFIFTKTDIFFWLCITLPLICIHFQPFCETLNYFLNIFPVHKFPNLEDKRKSTEKGCTSMESILGPSQIWNLSFAGIIE